MSASRLIKALLAAGMQHVEVAAFVSPKAVPAMAGAAEVVAGLADERGRFSVLIPNMRGYELAMEAGARAVAMVLYGTDGMAQANVRMSRAAGRYRHRGHHRAGPRRRHAGHGHHLGGF